MAGWRATLGKPVAHKIWNGQFQARREKANGRYKYKKYRGDLGRVDLPMREQADNTQMILTR